jgi:hypothetical protein
MELIVAVNETVPPKGESLSTTRLAGDELVLVDLADAGPAAIPRTATNHHARYECKTAHDDTSFV